MDDIFSKFTKNEVQWLPIYQDGKCKHFKTLSFKLPRERHMHNSRGRLFRHCSDEKQDDLNICLSVLYMFHVCAYQFSANMR